MSMSFYCYRESADGSTEFYEDEPNFSNTNAMMIVRSLGYEPDYCMRFDPSELLGRLTLARAMPPVDDSGFASTRVGNVIDCGIRPGYFADAYERIAEVCEQALAWGVPVVAA